MKFTKEPPTGNAMNEHFIKLKDGDSVKVILRGEPHEFFQLFENGKPRYVPEGTPDARFAFRINAVINENGNYIAKIFGGGSRMYRTLKELSQDYDLSQVVLKISRKGSKMNDTVYSAIPMPGTIPDATKASIAQIKLLDLSFDQKELPPTNEPLFDTEHTDLPF